MIVLTFVVFPSIAVRAKKGKKKTLCGADVAIMHLKQENDYLPDLNELKSLVTPETKMICINNPTGALMSKELLGSIVEIARGVGAYILCDEVYRHLTQEDEWCESIVDLYEKGISVSSMSKVFSLAGLRMAGLPRTMKRRARRSCRTATTI